MITDGAKPLYLDYSVQSPISSDVTKPGQGIEEKG